MGAFASSYVLPNPPRLPAPTTPTTPYVVANPLRSPTRITPPLTFRDVERDFIETLEMYGEEYGDEEASLDHFEIKDALEDGIRQARRPRNGLKPQQLADEVERAPGEGAL
jgi:hypothetical protein